MAKRYNTITQKWENITLDWIKETEELKKETKKIKKYYNEKGQEFRLKRGAIADLKSHQGWCDYFLAYNEDDNYYYTTSAMGYIDYEGNREYNLRISWNDKITRKDLAYRLGYIFDKTGKMYDDAEPIWWY